MDIKYSPSCQKVLWQEGIQRVYVIWGPEDVLKEEVVRAAEEKLLDPGFIDFDREVVDAGSADAATILGAACQVPFMSERRLVVVRGAEHFRDKNRQADLERMIDLLPSVPDTACLLFVVASGDDEVRRKTAISAKFDSTARGLGAVVCCQELGDTAIASWIVDYLAARGKRLDPRTARMIIDGTGSEMRLIEHELDKLASYTGDRAVIEAGDVARVVSVSPDDVMFPVIDATVTRQTERALVLLAELHRYDPRPQGVAARLIALLHRQYRMLWQAKLLVESRVSPREIRSLPGHVAAQLPVEGNISQIAFRASETFVQARNYSWGELEGAFDALLLCDLANKGGVTGESGAYGSDPVVNLQILTVHLTSGAQPQNSVSEM